MAARALDVAFVVGVAILLTLLNAAKPVTIDDPIYLAVAGQIARHPLDPYGFTLHWYQSPQPAFDILAPPLLPYWLALPSRVFGAAPVTCKLSLLPFSALLVAALHALLRRWAGGIEKPLVILTVLSPAILPSYNVMLDVPMLALALGALAVFTRAVDHERAGLAIAAGLLAGLAAETKYNGLLAPAVLLLYALVQRRWRLGVLAAGTAAVVFAATEACLWHAYGSSLLLHHLSMVTTRTGKRALLHLPLLADLGGTGTAVLLLGLAALGVTAPRLAAVAALVLAGYAAIAMRPPPHDVLLNTQLIRRPISVSLAVCGAFGVGLFAATAAIGARLLGRAADGRREGRRDDLFLVLWLVLEVVGFYVFTPFPAVRRVLGLFVVMTVLSGRLAARTCRTARRRRVIDAVVVFGVSLGLAFYAIDFRDAEAARLAVERAAQRIGTVAPGTTVWYAGHWGLQFYADRAGMHLVAPGASRLRRGDWLLIPDPPVDRPHFALRGEQVEAVVPPIEVGDDLPFATVVTYYAGFVPLRAQRGPRYRLSLYRVRDDFTAVP